MALIFIAMKSLRFPLFAIASFCYLIGVAQHHVNQTTNKCIEYVIGDSTAATDDAYQILLDNIPVDPEYTAPQFAIIDNNKRFYMSLGATVKAIGTYDWCNPYDNPTDFKTSDLYKASPGNEQLTQMTIKSSSVNFNIVGMPSNKYRTGIFIALTFNGGTGNEFITKCDYAYIKIARFTLGYASSLYDDKSVNPYLIDGNGAGASGAHSNMTFNYQRYLNPYWKFGVALEMPRLSMTHFNKEETDPNQSTPDFPFYLQYGWNQNNHVRISSVIRTLPYINSVTQKRTSLMGYGVKLTSALTARNATIFLMAQGGEGIANYLKNNEDRFLDLVPDDPATGQYRRTKSWGGLCAVQYDFSPSLFSTAMWGYMRNHVNEYAGGIIPFDGQLKYEHYAAVNFIWRASPFINIGAEYNYGIKRTFDNTAIHNNRISAMVRVGF